MYPLGAMRFSICSTKIHLQWHPSPKIARTIPGGQKLSVGANTDTAQAPFIIHALTISIWLIALKRFLES